MTANTTMDWLKRWGLWILIGLAVVLWLLAKLLPSPKGKPEILQKAKEEAQAIKDNLAKELKEHAGQMQANHDELERIKKIQNEAERLKALADFANKKKGGTA